jgi:hypothetical protein
MQFLFKNYFFLQFLLFIILINFSTVFSQSSTIYVDGENDMTVPVLVSGAQIKKIRSQMLDAFGIRSPSRNLQAPDKFVSRYMTSLYKFLGHTNEINFNPSFRYLDKDTGTTDFDFNKILSDSDQFDSIIGFVPENITPNSEKSKSSLIGKNVIEYDFRSDSDDSLSDESLRLVHAELYFAVENDTIPLDSIKVFFQNGEEFKEISGSQTIRMNNTQLLAVNVTKIVQKWIFYPNSDRKLYVKLDGISQDLDFSNPLESFIPDLHCFGVGFFVETDDEEFPPIFSAPNRIRRDTSSIPSENDINENDEMPEDEESNDIPVFPSSSSSSTSSSKSRTFDILSKPRSDSCRVRTLFIDFNAIGWGEFVVAPSGYRANYCDGGCPFPLDMKFNPSNHATVQTLIHLIDKNKTGEALCAPSSMDKPLSFLFIDNNQVKIKKYLDMSVIQCGCQ